MLIRIRKNTQAAFTCHPEPQAGLKGAALLAYAGVGLIGNLSEAALARRVINKTVSPQKKTAEVYAAALAEYSRIYDHMLGFWQTE